MGINISKTSLAIQIYKTEINTLIQNIIARKKWLGHWKLRQMDIKSVNESLKKGKEKTVWCQKAKTFCWTVGNNLFRNILMVNKSTRISTLWISPYLYIISFEWFWAGTWTGDLFLVRSILNPVINLSPKGTINMTQQFSRSHRLHLQTAGHYFCVLNVTRHGQGFDSLLV